MESPLTIDLGPIRLNCSFNFRVTSKFDRSLWAEGVTYEQSPLDMALTFLFIRSDVHNSVFRCPIRDLLTNDGAHPYVELGPLWEHNPLWKDPLTCSLIESAIQGGDYKVRIHNNQMLIVDYENHKIADVFCSMQKRDLIAGNSLRALRLVLPHVLPQNRASFLHSAGVFRERDKGIVFVARSGGGKSTATQLSIDHGYSVIGDDQIIVVIQDDRIIACSTPFNSISEGPNWCEVRGFFMLNKGRDCLLKRSSPSEVLPKIWRDNVFEWRSLNSPSKVVMFGLYWDFFSRVPIYEMTFPRDYIDWDLVEETISI